MSNPFYALADALGIELTVVDAAIRGEGGCQQVLPCGRVLKVTLRIVSSYMAVDGSLGVLARGPGNVGLFVSFLRQSREVVSYVLDVSKLAVPDELFERLKVDRLVMATEVLKPAIVLRRRRRDTATNWTTDEAA